MKIPLLLLCLSLLLSLHRAKAQSPGENDDASSKTPPSEDPLGLVLVRGGTFTMGCTNEQQDCEDDEKPAHNVTLSDFYIGKYEVTQAQWREIIGDNPSYARQCQQCPVEMVSWIEIQYFLKRLNQKYPGLHYRLPTEAEWEYAARGGGKAVLFGNGKDTLNPSEANFIATEEHQRSYSNLGEYPKKTTPVGTFVPNALGLYDMSGNVWEWCADWYGSGYYQNSPPQNPAGPDTGAERVCRGGSWFNGPEFCRVANRDHLTPDFKFINLGFRLARTP